MTPLFTAIYDLLDTSALDTNHIGDRMYPNEAPQGATFPYATYELVAGTTDWTFCADMSFDDCVIQFNLFSDDLSSPVEVNGMFTNLIALYDWCNLTHASLAAAGYTSLYMHRELFHLMRDIDAGVWQYIVQYRVLLES